MSFATHYLLFSPLPNIFLPLHSAGSVGKDYYSDPKYLNVLTGAVGKLQEVIPSSTNPSSHLHGRSGEVGTNGATNPKKGPKTFTAVASTTQPSSLKYPQVESSYLHATRHVRDISSFYDNSTDCTDTSCSIRSFL